MDAASERASLLERHKPALRYDSQEVYFADSAAEWTDNPGNELIRATGEVVAIAGAAPPQTALSLDLLGSYSDPEPADAIADPRRDYQAQYAAQHSQADARPWSKVERDPGSKARPVVYSARGSHASYFEPGLHWATVWFDHADGKGFSREMALETLR